MKFYSNLLQYTLFTGFGFVALLFFFTSSTTNIDSLVLTMIGVFCGLMIVGNGVFLVRELWYRPQQKRLTKELPEVYAQQFGEALIQKNDIELFCSAYTLQCNQVGFKKQAQNTIKQLRYADIVSISYQQKPVRSRLNSLFIAAVKHTLFITGKDEQHLEIAAEIPRLLKPSHLQRDVTVSHFIFWLLKQHQQLVKSDQK